MLAKSLRIGLLIVLLALLSQGQAGTALAGTGAWTSRGLYGKGITALALDPQNPATLYAANLANSGGGGVYKYLGGDWSLVGLGSRDVYSLAADPDNPGTLYAGTNVGVFKSTNGGSDWNPTALQYCTCGVSRTGLSVRALVIDAQHAGTLYATTWYACNYSCGGVWKSTNGGDSWRRLSNGPPADLNAESLALNPQNTNIIYAGTLGWGFYGGAFRSTDGGDTWSRIVSGLTNLYVHALAVDPRHPTTLYAGTGGSGVFKSTDSGDNWHAVNTGPTNPGPSVEALAIGPQDPTTLYAGTHDGVFKSTNGGDQWTPLNDGLTNLWVNALVLDPRNPAVLYAGTTNGVFDLQQQYPAFFPVVHWSTAFGASTGWTSQDAFPRALADVNADGKADVVGFGAAGTYVSLSTGTGLSAMTRWSTGFGCSVAAGSWVSQTIYPRMLGDVDGDGKADVVGFGGAGAYVALANATGTALGPVSKWTSSFGFLPSAGGWTSQDIYPRFLADVTGDGKADVVGFGGAGVYVARSTGTGFAAMTRWSPSFGFLPAAGGWTSQNTYPRFPADVNGDQKADIVGFGAAGVYVALATPSGVGTTATAFGPMSPAPWIRGYGASVAAGSWVSQDTYPRTLADINADGKADIVGYGGVGAYYALSTGVPPPAGIGFGPIALGSGAFGFLPAAGGWASQNQYPRFSADMNHDHKADLVGFGAAGVYVGLHN